MKAGAIGRLGDVTKLLQTQRRDSQRRMQDFVNGNLPSLLRKTHKVAGPGASPTENS